MRPELDLLYRRTRDDRDWHIFVHTVPRVNLRHTHTGADPTSPYAKRQARHEHATRDAIHLITQFVPYRRNATDLGLLHYVPEPAI